MSRDGYYRLKPQGMDIDSRKIGPVIVKGYGRKQYNDHLGDLIEYGRQSIAYGRHGAHLDTSAKMEALAKTHRKGGRRNERPPEREVRHRRAPKRRKSQEMENEEWQAQWAAQKMKAGKVYRKKRIC